MKTSRWINRRILAMRSVRRSGPVEMMVNRHERRATANAPILAGVIRQIIVAFLIPTVLSFSPHVLIDSLALRKVS